jgi:predicted molibdopterin-dependent oxidoreductase YjgC
MSLAKEVPLFDLGITKTRSVCGYCGVGCSVDIMTKDNRILGIQPAMDGL